MFVSKVLTAALLLGPPILAVVASHPYQLSYANLFVGGVRGLERNGLEVTNLKEVLRPDVLSDPVDAIPADAVVDGGFFFEELCFHRAVGTIPETWQLESALPDPENGEVDTLACTGPRGRMPARLERPPATPDYVFVLNRKAQWRPLEWSLHHSGARPFYELSWQGVPLLLVYRAG